MEEAAKVNSDDLIKDDMDKEEEDTTFDGGFVKVEKEGIDTKYDDEKRISIERSSSGSQRELHESQEKAKNLVLELEKVTGELKRYESESTLLKDELFFTIGRLEETEKKHEELEVVQKNLQEKISEGEDRQRTHLKSLEDALQSHDAKHKEYQEKVTKLESSLSQTSARNSELEEDLRIALQKGAEHEDLGNVISLRSLELEALFQLSQSKLEKAEEKLKDFEAFQVKNTSLEVCLSEAMEKLKSAEERLEKQAREIDEATTRSIELEALHKQSEVRIQKADTEVKSLNEKSKDLEERIRLDEEKLAEASDQSLSLKEELDQSFSENELLADTNNQLKLKIQELEGYLDYEKETAMRQTEEATERFNQRDIEAKDLITKLKSHENVIEEHKRQVFEASGVADTRKMELEEALSKLETLEATIKELEKENGDLADVNLKINQELANQGSETSDLETKVSALEAEKDEIAKELHASKTVIENLTNQLTSEGERLRSQISSLVEENNQVNKMYQSTKNELVKLQEQLEVEKSQKYSELEATLKKSQEELEAKNSMNVLLESLYKELEHKVQLADAKSKETESTGKEEVEVKSRDIDVSFTPPKKRKSKKESDDSPSHSSSSGNVTIQKTETSHLMTLKIVLGVALVSIIIGIILGKKY